MSHTFFWPKKSFFYAIGNTVPVCLTQDIPPENSANVLLLGCGDPRNILFTIHASGADTTTLPRCLDFTCCDMEPAVLARNLLLFSLIIDGEASSTQIWNIFYDFFLKTPDAELLAAQSRKLADLAKDVETWGGSKYSAVLKVSTRRTLAELHRHWVLYAGFEEIPPTRKTKVKEAFTSGMKGVADKYKSVAPALRSAGPLLVKAVLSASEHHAHFWRTGINSMDPKDRMGATLLNPLFVYSASGEEFAVHYGTDASSAFPLAPAFAQLKGSAGIKGKAGASAASVRHSQALFMEWSKAFKSAVDTSSSKLVIRFFAGDALNFCRALHYCLSTSSTSSGLYNSAWKDARLELDSGDYIVDAPSCAPLTFDVIDTSNLTDHLGLLNILVVTIPLLTRNAHSVIFTETLLSLGEDAVKGFMDQVGGDLTVMALLLDLTPSTFVSNFSTYSNVHEILLHGAFTQQSQFHERTSWKILSLADPLCQSHTAGLRLPLSFEARPLANLFDVYHQMFTDENLATYRQRASAERLGQLSLVHYVRASFAMLLRYLKDRTQTDWASVMNQLFKLWNVDRELVFGSNFYQDLCCQLHLSDVFSVETFSPDFPIQKTGIRLRSWKNIPPVVCLVLVVPRDFLKKPQGLDPTRIGTPILQCEVRGPDFLNYYSSIHATFGRLKSSDSGEETVLSLDEDSDGWSGRAPLVVSFWIPSWSLANYPNETMRVTLIVRSTAQTMQTLMRTLGPDMAVFGAPLTDKTAVFISRERPNHPGELDKIKAVSFSQPSARNAAQVSVVLDASDQHISTFSAKVEVEDEAEQKVLLDGAAVTYDQVSPCGIKIMFGSVGHTAFFPFPVDVTKVKLRIARKSHYIEVIVPPSGHMTSGGFFVDPFPVIFHGQTPTLWNMHRLYLDRLPAVDIMKSAELDWLNPHVSLMMSDRERRSVSASQVKRQTVQQTLIDIKESLHAMYVRFTGIQGDGRHAIFGLNEHTMGGIYTLIFITDLRLDLAANTVVLDAYALPLTTQLVNRVTPFLQRLQTGRNPPVLVNPVDNEMRAWKRLLPALAERCRHSWKHAATCEYVQGGKVPVSLEYAESPICSCGQGKDVDSFKRISTWAELAPLVTRIALSPLFAVSYLETVAGNLGGGFSYEPSASSSTLPGGVCARCGDRGKPKLLKCGQCKAMDYCSAECQRADWKTHKPHCVKV